MERLNRKEILIISGFVVAIIICITSAIVVKAHAAKKREALAMSKQNEVHKEDFVFDEDFDFENMLDENLIDN